MLKALAFGLAVGVGIQAWRNFPPESPVAPSTVAVVFIVGVCAAYLGGRWHGRGRASATATATATAESSSVASNQVNLAVVVPGQGAGASMGARVPEPDSLPWMGAPGPALTADQLDGMDLSELVEDHDQEGTYESSS